MQIDSSVLLSRQSVLWLFVLATMVLCSRMPLPLDFRVDPLKIILLNNKTNCLYIDSMVSLERNLHFNLEKEKIVFYDYECQRS